MRGWRAGHGHGHREAVGATLLPTADPDADLEGNLEPEAFAADLARPHPVDDVVRGQLVSALHAYLDRSGLKADWAAVEEAPVDALINSLSAGCPFTNPEKQALLEARTLEDRCAALITLLKMERPGQGGGYVQ